MAAAKAPPPPRPVRSHPDGSDASSSSPPASVPAGHGSSSSARGSASATVVPSSATSELRAMAHIELSAKFTPKSYVGAITALLDRARNSDNLGELENAFVSYLKAATILTQLPKHPDWAHEKNTKSHTYERWHRFFMHSSQLVERTTRIEEQLAARSLRQSQVQASTPAQASAPPPAAPPAASDTPRDGPASGDGDLQHADLVARLSALHSPPSKPATTFPSLAEFEQSLPSSHLPSVPLNVPGTGPSGPIPTPPRVSAPSATSSPALPPPRLISPRLPAVSPAPARPTSAPGAADDAHASAPAPGPIKKKPPPPPPASSRPTAKPVSTLPGAGDGTLGELPPPPPTTILRAVELWPLLNPLFGKRPGSEKLEKFRGFKVLLLDVRPREAYDKAHIFAKYTVSIDPVILRPDMRGKDIEERLLIGSPEEQHHFAHRNEFDLVVLYDQASRRAPQTPLSADNPLEIVNRAIYELEFDKPLRRQPIFLNGGFSSWEKLSRPDGTESKVPLVTGSASAGTSSSGPGSGTLGASASSTTSQIPPARMFRPSVPAAAASLTSPSLRPARQAGALDYPALRAASSYAPSPSLAGLSSPPPAVHSFAAPLASHHTPSALPPPRPPSHAPPSVPAPPPLPPSHPASSPRPAASTSAPSATGPVVSSASGVGTVSRRRPMRIGMTGLRNVANTCYMNSVVQCLSATPELAQFFVRGDYKQQINHANPLGTNGQLADAFATLLRTLWSEQYEYIRPVSFRQVLTRVLPSFAGNEQHDCHEFLSFLTDTLHEDLNQPSTKAVARRPGLTEDEQRRAEEAELERLPIQEGAEREWTRYTQTNDSFVLKEFAGMLRNRMKCSVCGTTSTTYNVFRDLSLPIPTSHGTVSVYDALDAFLAPEVLDGDDRWTCSTCKVPRRATKQLALARLPAHLIIHLKRFSFTAGATRWGSKEGKITARVDFPLEGLDLTRFLPASTTVGSAVYDLYGVVHHFGTLDSGHYTATIRNDGRWDYADDSRITPNCDRELHTNSPYVLWYQRRM